jgi:hypothetical protein
MTVKTAICIRVAVLAVLSGVVTAQTLPTELEGLWRNPRNGHSQIWRIQVEDQTIASALSGKIVWYGFGGYCTTPKEGMPFAGSYDGEKLVITAALLNPNTKCGKLLVEMKKDSGEEKFVGTFSNDWPVSGTVELKSKK